MSRILVVGPAGQIGFELCRTLTSLGQVITAGPGKADFPLDLASPDSIREVLSGARADVIVNAAAYTAVDQAELEPEAAFAINRDGPGVMAETAARQGALLVHYSTDYVFDGGKQDAYTETDAPNPVSVYGKSKLGGEQAVQAAGGRHLIFRTSWVYGLRGHNFLLTMLHLAAERESLSVVDDQFGVPNWSGWLAEATAAALATVLADPARAGHASGIYHLSAAGETTWHGFAGAILAAVRHEPGIRATTVTAITTSEYPTPAARPARSTLDATRFAQAFRTGIPHWRACLRQCLAARG